MDEFLTVAEVAEVAELLKLNHRSVVIGSTGASFRRYASARVPSASSATTLTAFLERGYTGKRRAVEPKPATSIWKGEVPPHAP